MVTMKRHYWTLLLFGYMLCGTARAGGIQIQLVGHRQTGMAHTGTGLALDGSSVFTNPGALAFVARPSVQFGAYVWRPRTQFQAQTPVIYFSEMEPLLYSPIYVYASLRTRLSEQKQRWAFGIGINNPFLGGSDWPDDWKGKFITQEYGVNTLFIQPSVCRQINGELSVGVGIVYGVGTMISRRAIQADGVNGTDASALFSGGGQGLGLNSGIYWQPHEHLSLGLSYRSPMHIRIENGKATFVVPESLSSLYPEQSFSSQIYLPGVLNAGLGFKAEDRFLLALDVNMTLWSRIDSVPIRLSKPVSGLFDYPERNYINTFSFRAGGEYIVTENLLIRGGVYYDGSPSPQGYVTPELPDSDRIGLTVGFSMTFWRALTLDCSYVHEFTGERSSLFEPAVFGGIYQSVSNMGGIGIKYSFK
ncbi:MAG: hypothetical protein EAZ89_16610 [Bacteroidetes bacterium]|nr:MAG: hypothetical protein EAZ89_16610 [Bacteroidota bacterium]